MQNQPRIYCLVIKRKNNDFLPVDWNLTKFYQGENLYTLDGIHPFSKKNYIPLEITFDREKCTGCITEHVGRFSWNECKFDGVNDAIAKINSIVETDLLSSASFALKTEEKLSNSRDNLTDITQSVIDIEKLKVYTGNMKDKVIDALEDALKQLKNS
jgi:hypothetical protein